MSIVWPEELISDLARRRCVLVLGAGISRNSKTATGVRPKLWGEFLTTAIAKVPCTTKKRTEIKKLIARSDFLTACQVIRDGMGVHAFHSLAKSEFLDPGFKPAAIHDQIISLDARIVITPNFDTIYENHVNHVQDNTVAVKHYYDNDVAECIRSVGRMVLKNHGSINTPNKMIFTRNDYTTSRNKYSVFYSILEALVATNTFLFLGCGFDDPDSRLLLEDYGFKHEFSMPHYFVIPSSAVHKDILPSLEKSLNIKCLQYAAVKGDHSAFLTSVTELVASVNAKRDEFATTRNW